MNVEFRTYSPHLPGTPTPANGIRRLLSQQSLLHPGLTGPAGQPGSLDQAGPGLTGPAGQPGLPDQDGQQHANVNTDGRFCCGGVGGISGHHRGSVNLGTLASNVAQFAVVRGYTRETLPSNIEYAREFYCCGQPLCTVPRSPVNVPRSTGAGFVHLVAEYIGRPEVQRKTDEVVRSTTVQTANNLTGRSDARPTGEASGCLSDVGKRDVPIFKTRSFATTGGTQN